MQRTTPNLIYDAVKNLVAKKGSGLIIKNIFKLPISDNVIRYANHMNFPIFVLNDSYPFFEDIIILINKAMERYNSFYYREQKVNLLLASDDKDLRTITGLICDISTSVQDELLVMTMKYKKGHFTTGMYRDIESMLYASGCLSPEDAVFYYKNGIMFILSVNNFKRDDIEGLVSPYLDILGEKLIPDFDIGVSGIHNIREELAPAIRESFYALKFCSESSRPYAAFDELGPYQVILPNTQQLNVQNYMVSYISPLEKYDSEKNSDILATVVEFVKCGGDLERTGHAMGQHKNTIRYRLKRAGEILGLNPLSLGDYERLALAVRIYICCSEPSASNK